MTATDTHTTAVAAAPGSPALAAGASLLLPGLGQLLARRPGRAAAFFLAWAAALGLTVLTAACPVIAPACLLVLVAALALMVVAAVDAARLARRVGLVGAPRVSAYALTALAAAGGVFCWVLLEKAGAPRWSAGGVLSSLEGRYAVATLAFAVVIAGVAFVPGSATAARLGLAVVIPLVMVWPLDKVAQHTALYMARNVTKPVAVRGNSMWPNFTNGEIVIAHANAAIRRFDPIAYKAPGENGDYIDIKRVVGLPGETVEVIEGELFINGAPTPTPPQFTPIPTGENGDLGRRANGAAGNPVQLGPDEYYVLGDNLAASYDSRYATAVEKRRQPGAIPAGRVIGRVTWQVWPATPWRK